MREEAFVQMIAALAGADLKRDAGDLADIQLNPVANADP